MNWFRWRPANRGFVAGMAGYVLYVAVVSVALGSLNYQPPLLVGCLLALPAITLAGYALVSQYRFVASREGVERHVQVESAALAFLSTMLGVMTYALLESFAELPALSLWSVWAFGMVSWGAASVTLRRKYG
ncbi:MAG: hypothetical protein JOZ47_20190 [Kutzneria sp.]|nr:hypothetical protein [Kutzneria sp.]